MYKILLLVILIIVNLFSKTFDFDETLNETLKNNKKLKLQELNTKAVETDIDKVDGFTYGQLNFINEFSRTNHAGYVFNSKLSSREASFRDFGFSQFGQPMDTQPIDLNYPDDRNNFNSKITYDLPIFTGFKLSKQKEILKLKHKAEVYQLNLDKKSLELEVLRSYNAAVVAKEYIKATQKAKEATNLFVKTANEFYKEGLVTKIDTKQAKVHELNIQSKLTEAKNNFDLSIAYLKFLTSNETIEDVKELKTIKIDSKNINILYEDALKQRDDFKIMDQYKKGMKENIDLNRSSYYPNIYSHLEYGVNDGNIEYDSDKDYYMAMVGIKLTLFDTSRSADVEKSKIDFNKTVLNQNQLKDAIKLQLKKAILNLEAKEKIYIEKKEAKELSNEVLEQSKLMYKNQLISMADLLKQEAIFRENEALFINSLYEKSLAQATLNFVLGNSLQEKESN